MVTFGLVAYLETSAFKDLSAHSGVGGPLTVKLQDEKASDIILRKIHVRERA